MCLSRDDARNRTRTPLAKGDAVADLCCSTLGNPDHLLSGPGGDVVVESDMDVLAGIDAFRLLFTVCT